MPYKTTSTSIIEDKKRLSPISLQELPKSIQDACIKAGWKDLMPVQSQALPYLIENQDVMVQSCTGSGKTGTYLLPLLSHINPAIPMTQTLVLVPTRELALQVEQEAEILFKNTGILLAAVYGGVGYGKQYELLRQGAHLVVGTPGRILDHLLKKTLSLKNLSSLIIDEADRMLSIGFYPDMKEVQKYLPRHPIHTAFFSATYPPHVRKLADEFLKEPQWISLSNKNVHATDVQHMFCECKKMEKNRVLTNILEVENPTSAIIFCNTKSDVHLVNIVLQNFGLNADELSADLSQNRREKVLQCLRSGSIKYLVATDVAARGIDVPNLSHVILYSPPFDRESYIHRAGRTGRAGATGVVISLVDLMQKAELQRIARFYKIPLTPYNAPTNQELAAIVGEHALACLENDYRQLTKIKKEQIKRFDKQIQNILENPEQISLLSLLFDEYYQQNSNPKSLVTTEVPSNDKQIKKHSKSLYSSNKKRRVRHTTTNKNVKKTKSTKKLSNCSEKYMAL